LDLKKSTLLKQLRRISTRELYVNPWWKYLHDRYTRPDDSEGDYFYIQTPGSVAVIPVFDDGKILLLNQYRYLNRRECLEFPGGGMKEGVPADETARLELLEEAGIRARTLIPIGSFNPMNGATDELCHVFIAKDLEQGEAMPEASEEFEPMLVSETELELLIQNGTIWDGMTLAAFALYKCFKHT
jgi:8-oxo-dGTP pyrophosphatase MutT (NUDIX family)